MSDAEKGSKREMFDRLDATGADWDSNHFQRARLGIEVQIAEDLETSIGDAARAGRGLMWALVAATAVGAAGTVVGAIAAFG